jgi:hypothetical protein
MERFFAWRGVESVIGDTPDGSTGLSEPDQQYPLVLSNQRLAGVCGACAEVYSLVLNQRYQGLPNTRFIGGLGELPTPPHLHLGESG